MFDVATLASTVLAAGGAAYDAGRVVGVIVGLAIVVAVLGGIGYGVYRLTGPLRRRWSAHEQELARKERDDR